MTYPHRRSERIEHILQIAGQLFARQGYHGTSTREIARVAGINENTLFRYFTHKENLFWAALGSRLSDVELRRDVVNGISKHASPEVVLPKLLTQWFDITIVRPELVRLIAVAYIEFEDKVATFCYEHLSPFFSTINEYLAANIKAGKLRHLDPSLLLSALLAMAMIHPEFSKLIPCAPPPHSSIGEIARVYSNFWLDVLTPPELARSKAMARIAETDTV